MTIRDVVERTRDYIRDQFLYARPDVRLAEDEPLFERGIVDSMGVVELVQFLENEFGIFIGDDELTEQHFRSLHSIAQYVCSKRAISAAT
jgi:acyl carrier protein